MNLYASRSFEDLSQYPIMPWVFASYKNNENIDRITLRDMRTPVGAISKEKVEMFKSKYFEMVKKQPKLSPYLDQPST